MLKKSISYLLFVARGAQASVKDGKGFSFILDEAKAKKRRFETGEVRRKFDSVSASAYTAFPSPVALPHVHVFSLCHGGGTPEQKLSILSFLRHVGSPARWTIVSDGSISDAKAESLRELHPSIEVVDWSAFISDENRECYEILAKHTVFAKKLVLESNLPVDQATVYVDTDIVFFGFGQHFRTLLATVAGRSYYQRDLPGFLDPSFLTADELKAPPLNAGFVVLGRRLDWSGPMARLTAAVAQMTSAQKIGDLEKLEQATAHAAHVLAGSQPLDDKFVLEVSDRLDDEDRFAGPGVVMRHYTRPVRHKMWAQAAEYLR